MHKIRIFDTEKESWSKEGEKVERRGGGGQWRL